MSILSEWLKEIIFVVLIAVFIDLLLPNRSMERYVKFVVSLIILLTLLSPVMRLLSAQSAEKLEMAISDNISGMDNVEAKLNTGQILQQGEEIRKRRESEALQWTGEEAARQMKTQIQRETGLPVARVTVKLSTANDSNRTSEQEQGLEPSISEVEVVMSGVNHKIEQNEDTSNAVKDVKPVADVEHVEVGVSISPNPKQEESQPVIGQEQGKSTEANAVAKSGEQEKARDRTVDQIMDILREDWGVPRQAVTVVMEEK
ncbi:Stage III sporulation protein AF [compost metagenome]